MNDQDFQFNPADQWGDYLVVSDVTPLQEAADEIKTMAESFIPKDYHKQIKYWDYDGYMIKVGDRKGQIISVPEGEQWKKDGRERYLLPVRVYCWKYTPRADPNMGTRRRHNARSTPAPTP